MKEDGEVGGNLTITLHPPAKTDGVSVPWSLVDPYAKLGFYDSKAAASNEIVFPGGTVTFNKSESQKTGLIKPVDDQTVEPDENAYFWMTDASIVNNAYTLDAGTFAQITIADDEWRWVQQTDHGGFAEHTYTIADTGAVTPDDWTPFLLWTMDTNYVTLSGKSAYVSNPIGTESESKIIKGFITYDLDNQTGVISASNQSEVLKVNVAPTTVDAGWADETFDNSGADEHTVSFKIYMGATCYGTNNYQFGTGIVTFQAQQTYGMGLGAR